MSGANKWHKECSSNSRESNRAQKYMASHLIITHHILVTRIEERKETGHVGTWAVQLGKRGKLRLVGCMHCIAPYFWGGSMNAEVITRQVAASAGYGGPLSCDYHMISCVNCQTSNLIGGFNIPEFFKLPPQNSIF